MISKGFCCLLRGDLGVVLLPFWERGEERADLEVAREEVVEYRDKDLPCRAAAGSYPGMVSLWSMLVRKGDNSTRGDPCLTRSVALILFWPRWRCRGEEKGVAEPSGRCGFHGEGSEIRRGFCCSSPSEGMWEKLLNKFYSIDQKVPTVSPPVITVYIALKASIN